MKQRLLVAAVGVPLLIVVLVFLPISTHFTATLGIPLTSPTLSCIVSKAVPGLSPGLSLQTYTAVYAPFTPSKSG